MQNCLLNFSAFNIRKLSHNFITSNMKSTRPRLSPFFNKIILQFYYKITHNPRLDHFVIVVYHSVTTWILSVYCNSFDDVIHALRSLSCFMCNNKIIRKLMLVRLDDHLHLSSSYTAGQFPHLLFVSNDANY